VHYVYRFLQTRPQLERGEFDHVDDFVHVVRQKLGIVKQDPRVSNDTALLSIAHKVCKNKTHYYMYVSHMIQLQLVVTDCTAIPNVICTLQQYLHAYGN
jgi:hypothetical protein